MTVNFSNWCFNGSYFSRNFEYRNASVFCNKFDFGLLILESTACSLSSFTQIAHSKND